MKHFFDYDVNSPQERLAQLKDYPELTKFYLAVREELPQDEYEKLYEAEKQSFYSFIHTNSHPKQLQWIR
jgi:hypothetical protein